MAVLTTVAEVRELITLMAEDNTILHNFINTANVYREANLASSGLSTVVLTEIEKYLACHFAAMAEEKGGIVRETIDDATDVYNNDYGPGLRSTRFGQTAIILDTSGTLAGLASPQNKALFRVMRSSA
ncbi:MAG: hypothetical protein COA78_37085 [Blastopirellula sp.]|nr:MAG: hypothetical protein COA78_37085 [Blastopirellula sp.]